MIRVRFNDPGEFCAEIGRDGGTTDDGVLRTTLSFRTPSTGGAIQHVSLLASFMRAGRIVYLERSVGDVWPRGGDGPGSQKVMDTAEGLRAKVEAAAKVFHLEVRPGVYESASECVADVPPGAQLPDGGAR